MTVLYLIKNTEVLTYSGRADCSQWKIKQELEADSVSVTDTYGDGRHVSIDVVSNIFEGQSSVKRQRMVYKVPSLTRISPFKTG